MRCVSSITVCARNKHTPIGQNDTSFFITGNNRGQTPIISLILLFVSTSVSAEAITGFVTAITDGDTIKLLDTNQTEHKIRIGGIDAPEKVQPFGSKSQANMAKLAFNKNAVADCHKKSFDRIVCKVTVNGVDVGLQQVTDGMAWWYRKYAKGQSSEDRDLYEQAEMTAKLRRFGLWADTNPMPPWEWRRQ